MRVAGDDRHPRYLPGVNLSLVLDMAAAARPEMAAVSDGTTTLSAQALLSGARTLGARVRERSAPAVVYLGTNHVAYPLALFGAAEAGVPFVPLNYRLGVGQLGRLVASHPGALVVANTGPHEVLEGRTVLACDDVVSASATGDDGPGPGASTDPDAVAVLLYTSGTTAEPKAAVLRHRHLMSYIFSTVEFGSAGGEEAAVVAVPPYHVAGLANLLTNLYAGRRVVLLESFSAGGWLEAVRGEGATQAMVVPTMLAAVLDELDHGGEREPATPTLRSLSYGGARMPASVIERALERFPDVRFVHAYGLTETSSTICLLGPEDHRAALASGDPAVRSRLGSVGRPVPGIEIDVRTEDGTVAGPGQPGELYVRGAQVSGEYLGHQVVDGGGWFPTRDRGWIDDDGYVFVEGRADDTIIRGGENVAPDEVEEVLMSHVAVADAAVVGVPDPRWGQRICAAVVLTAGAELNPEELRAWCRERLRSSKTPDVIAMWDALPRTDTGKLLRRAVRSRLAEPLT